MNEDNNKEFDEELNDFLYRCYQLKQRAIRELEKPNSFPRWLECLLQYPSPKNDKADGNNK